MVSPVPEGFNTVSCCLVVPNAREALEFYRQAFGAETRLCIAGPDGQSTMHAEMKLGDSTVMLSDENPQWGLKSPKTLGGSAASLFLYVSDADALFEQAVQAGCTAVTPMHDMFWGDRFGQVTDPYGYVWSLATRKEELSAEEMQRRAVAAMQQMAQEMGQGAG